MTRHSRIWLAMALGIICAWGTPTARAGLVTPDSIGSPVVSSSGNGDAVAPGGLVFDQYRALGVLFSPEPQIADDGHYTAVVQVNNRDVFAGTYATITDGVSHVSYQSPASAPGPASFCRERRRRIRPIQSQYPLTRPVPSSFNWRRLMRVATF